MHKRVMQVTCGILFSLLLKRQTEQAKGDVRQDFSSKFTPVTLQLCLLLALVA